MLAPAEERRSDEPDEPDDRSTRMDRGGPAGLADAAVGAGTRRQPARTRTDRAGRDAAPQCTPQPLPLSRRRPRLPPVPASSALSEQAARRAGRRTRLQQLQGVRHLVRENQKRAARSRRDQYLLALLLRCDAASRAFERRLPRSWRSTCYGVALEAVVVVSLDVELGRSSPSGRDRRRWAPAMNTFRSMIAVMICHGRADRRPPFGAPENWMLSTV